MGAGEGAPIGARLVLCRSGNLDRESLQGGDRPRVPQWRLPGTGVPVGSHCRRAQGKARSACRHPPGMESVGRFPGPSGLGEVSALPRVQAVSFPAKTRNVHRSRGCWSHFPVRPNRRPPLRKADSRLEGKKVFLKISLREKRPKNPHFPSERRLLSPRRFVGTGKRRGGGRSLPGAGGLVER